jgi:hypothetical protein
MGFFSVVPMWPNEAELSPSKERAEVFLRSMTKMSWIMTTIIISLIAALRRFIASCYTLKRKPD